MLLIAPENEIKYDNSSIIELIKWSPNQIIFKTKSKSKQFLNISEIFYPNGWSVKNITKNIDVKVYEVNSLIRGIIIDKGENLYTLEYKPSENNKGSLITLSSFIILCLLLFSGIKYEDK